MARKTLAGNCNIQILLSNVFLFKIKHKKNQNQEIKHGRAAMLGFLHVIAIEAGVRLPGYLSVSQDLKFSDVPAGCFASLEAVPTAGWLQIMVLT